MQKKPSRLEAARSRLRDLAPPPAPAAEQPRDPRLALNDVFHLDKLSIAAVNWLWRPWLPEGKLSLIDGDPGQGKSFVTLDLAARLSRGDKFPDGSPGPAKPCHSLLICCEDGLRDTVLPRLDAMGADLRFIHAYQGRLFQGHSIRIPRLPDDLPELEAIIRDTQAKLVVIDPLMAFLAESVNSISDQSVRGVLTPLAALAERLGVTILFVRHLNKTGGKQAVYRGGGSIGIIATMRTAMLIARHPHDREQRVLAMVKCNLAKEPKSLAFRLAQSFAVPGATEVAWDGEVELAANDLVADVKQAVDPKDWLSKALAGGPCPAKQLLNDGQEAGFSESTLNRAKKALAVVSLQRGAGKSKEWWWALPDKQSPQARDMLEPLPGDFVRGDAWEG